MPLLPGNWFAPPGNNRSGGKGNQAVGAFGVEGSRYIVNYADDLVICCRVGAERALAAMREMMLKLKLTVNEKKTRVCHLRKKSSIS